MMQVISYKKAIFFILIGWMMVLGPWALAQEGGRTVMEAKFDLNSNTAAVKFSGPSLDKNDNEAYIIQLVLLWYATVLQQLGSDPQAVTLKAMAMQVVQGVASQDGLKRIEISSNLVSKAKLEGVKNFVAQLIKVEKTGVELRFSLSINDVAVFGPAATQVFFQQAIRDLSENGLRMFVLALGGMNKWYKEMGSSADVASVSKATAYGLGLAADIIEKLAGGKPVLSK